MACSSGGRMALQLAGRHPERVNKLVLYCAVAKNSWPESKARVFAYALMNPLVVHVKDCSKKLGYRTNQERDNTEKK